MSRMVYRPDHPCSNENGMVPIEMAGPKHAGDSACYVISDEMPATRHMADGRYYTSKKKFRDATREHGCVEVGNELATMTRPRSPIPLDRGKRREDIKRAIYNLRNGIR